MRWLAFTFIVVMLCGCRSYRRPTSEALTSWSKNALPRFIKHGKINRNMVLVGVTGGMFKDAQGNLLDQKKFSEFLNDLADVPYQAKIKRAILWRVSAPDGSQHWIFGGQHRLYPLENYPTNSELLTAIEQATIYMPETTLETTARIFDLDPSKPNHKQALEHMSKMLDHQISALGKSKNKQIIELDNFFIADKHSKEWQKAKKSDEKLNPRKFKDSEEFFDHQFDRGDLYLQRNQAYIDGDIDKYTQMSMQADPHWSIITDRRNKTWLKKIIKHCRGDERCLIYPGVNHLINDTGSLVSLLRNKGFTLERVY